MSLVAVATGLILWCSGVKEQILNSFHRRINDENSYDGYKECQPLTPGEDYWLCTDDGSGAVLTCLLKGSDFECYEDKTIPIIDQDSSENIPLGVAIDYKNRLAYVSTGAGGPPQYLARFSANKSTEKVRLPGNIQSGKKLILSPGGDWMVILDQQANAAWYLPNINEWDTWVEKGTSGSVYLLADFEKIHGASWVTLASEFDTVQVNGFTISSTHSLTASDGSIRYVSDQAFITGGGAQINSQYGPIAIVVSNDQVRSMAVDGSTGCACNDVNVSSMKSCTSSTTCTPIYYASKENWYSALYHRDGSKIVGATKLPVCEIQEFDAPVGDPPGSDIPPTAFQKMKTLARCFNIFYSTLGNIHGAAASISGFTYIASHPDKDRGGNHGKLTYSEERNRYVNATRLHTKVTESNFTASVSGILRTIPDGVVRHL